jgi:hypothetical protein
MPSTKRIGTQPRSKDLHRYNPPYQHIDSSGIDLLSFSSCVASLKDQMTTTSLTDIEFMMICGHDVVSLNDIEHQYSDYHSATYLAVLRQYLEEEDGKVLYFAKSRYDFPDFDTEAGKIVDKVKRKGPYLLLKPGKMSVDAVFDIINDSLRGHRRGKPRLNTVKIYRDDDLSVFTIDFG